MLWLILWELTLEKGQKKEIFNDTWRGFDNNWRYLPSGTYKLRGVVFLDDGNIFSEYVDITLEKSTNLLNYGNTLYVGGSGPDNYTNIQDAINDANNGDTV